MELAYAHLRHQAMASRGLDSAMMAANGNRVEGVPRFPNGNAGQPPSLIPFEGAFGLQNNGNQKNLFKLRKEREFIPEDQKDELYWNRRHKNNESARRSRDKRRNTDKVTASRCAELTEENKILTSQAFAFIKENQSLKARMEGNNNCDHHDPHSSGGSFHREQRGSVNHRTDDYSEQGRDIFVAPTPRQLPPKKPHQREHHPIYTIDQDDYRNNQSNSNTDHSSGRSSISPSENDLNLSPNGNQSSSESMEHDKEANSDSNECPTIPQDCEKKFEASAEHDGPKWKKPVSNGKFYGNGKNNQSNKGIGEKVNLPPKLRHKGRLGETRFPPCPYLTLRLRQKFRSSPPRTPWDRDDNRMTSSNGSGSSNGRDSGHSSGIFINVERIQKHFTENRQLSEAMDMKKRIEDSAMEMENRQLKFEVGRLTAEVAYLKTFLCKKKPVKKEEGNNQ